MSEGAETPRRDDDLAATAARLSASLLEGVQLRVELFALELTEERHRMGALFVSALAAAFAAVLSVLSLNVLLLVWFWDTHRTAVAAATFAFYVLVAVGFALRYRLHRRRVTPPFAATLDVLARDRRALAGEE